MESRHCWRATHYATRDDLAPQFDAAVFVAEFVAHQVVHGELDGFLGRDADQLRGEAAVKPKHALVTDHLLEAVNAVFVHEFAYH